MRADYVHPAEKIDEGSGWELIRKIVFGDGEDAIISELEEVGMEIVRKCDGLPLAIKVMAGVLFHKERTKTEWKKVVESDLWFRKEIKLSNALYLSYEDLPNHLKQCFLSCAFYHGISHRSDIIRLWVAEGFVIEELDSLMEVTAKDYYKELIARNLLQIDQRFEDGRLFVMHDVLRSFGEKLMEEEGIIISGENHCMNFQMASQGHRDSMSMMEGGCDLDDLQYLCNLNDLVISKLERARTTNFVLESKTFLRILTLGWTMHNNENNDEQSGEAERICKQLSPPATLEVLSINNFPGRQFPDWMVSTSLADLTFLALDKFPSCTALPPLGQLPNLKILHIEGGEAIKSIGPEFLGRRTPAFPKLEYLAFDSMRNWEEWVLRVAPIEDVHASNLNFFPNLEKCYFYDCPKLKNSIHPPTRLLQINGCPNLESMEKVGMLQLRKFEVVLPSEIKQLPKWISSLINMTLQSLQLFNMQCNSLVLDSCRKGKQNWHIIQHIPKVIIHSIGLETRLLRSKDGYQYQIKDELGSSFITPGKSFDHQSSGPLGWI
ncbi:putative disease resistance RPP13-like protein 1 [Zingiber officinale]|uniref:putative disease resistance RPP13-like protein 1 n=1 Tax=Zingiber officinale TaxID=94328 RepID=UPI001C4CC1C6|nr:putative disease resistance RPP13-like protein 1 [Zingiber officinale]